VDVSVLSEFAKDAVELPTGGHEWLAWYRIAKNRAVGNRRRGYSGIEGAAPWDTDFWLAVPA
jgi:hypothetical protein